MAQPIISLKNIVVEYPEGTGTMRALDDVTLEIYPEEYVIFFGPSGCGKSTLLYLISGLEKPTGGEVFVQDKNLATMSVDDIVEYHRKAVGMVFQAYYLIPSISVRANVALPQIFLGTAKSDRILKSEALLERFGILKQKGKVPLQLSGGQQQRVAIARSLINDPPLVLADEPVGNLDSKAADTFLKLLQELNEKDKKTIIMVTHNANYLSYAHRIFYMKDGKVVREVKNLERKQVREETMQPYRTEGLNEIAKLMPHLDENSLRARFIAQSLVGSLEADVEQKLESIVSDFLFGKIDRDGFTKKATAPLKEDGVGLYHTSAETLADEILAVMGMSQFLKKNFGNFPRSYEEYSRTLERIGSYLLLATQSHLTDKQLELFYAAIKGRLEGSLAKRAFRDTLDASVISGGVGLNIRASRAITERLELIMIDYQSMQQQKQNNEIQ